MNSWRVEISSSILAVCLLALILPCFPVRSEITAPLRSSSGLRQPRAEMVASVATARVLIFDRPLIEKDFPELKGKSDAQIKEFLLNQAGFISLPQAQQEETNSPITIDEQHLREALRPDYYGRALVYEVPGGMLDVKGSGSRDPRPHDQQYFHRNGLFALSEAIVEYVLERKIQEVLSHSGSSIRTVGSYAVIAWGFDLKDRGISLPAGAIIRQAHTRHANASTYRPELRSKNSFLTKEDSEFVEQILRAYSFSTEHESDETPRWLIDVQGTKDKDLVDFGTYHSRDHFFQTAFWYPERKLEIAQPMFTRENTPQPLKQLTPSWEVRNFINLPGESTRLARAYAAGEISENEVAAKINGLLKPEAYPQSLQGEICSRVLERMDQRGVR